MSRRNRKQRSVMDVIAAGAAADDLYAAEAEQADGESASADAEPHDGPDSADDGAVGNQSPVVVLLEVPIAPEFPPTEFCVHIDTRLDSRQSTTLRRIAEELDRQQATLANGQRVTHPTHAVKYLLEKLSGIPLRP